MSKTLDISHLGVSVLFCVCSKKTLKDWLEGSNLPPLMSPGIRFSHPQVQSRIESVQEKEVCSFQICVPGLLG